MTSQLDGSLDLSGRTALVTGAAGGIGLACARRLASAGADVVVTDIRAVAAEEAAKAIDGEGGGGVRAVVADLADLDVVDALARECAPDILVNCVAPGWVDTDMAAPAFAGGEKARIAATIPLRRIPTAEQIAGPIVFLSSDLASHITGEVLNVNGGSVLCG